MENGRIIDLATSNANHCLSRFVAPPVTTSVLLIRIAEQTKHKMAIGLYLTFAIIAVVGIVAGTISYFIRNGRRDGIGPLKPMRMFEEYTADDIHCLHYAYRSHRYFKFLTNNTGVAPGRCAMCEKEEEHRTLLRIAHNMTLRARKFGRSPRVEELIAKGRRLRRSDGIPEHVDPHAPPASNSGIRLDETRMEAGLEGHTCARAYGEMMRLQEEAEARQADMIHRITFGDFSYYGLRKTAEATKLRRPRLRPRKSSEASSFSAVESGGCDG